MPSSLHSQRQQVELSGQLGKRQGKESAAAVWCTDCRSSPTRPGILGVLAGVKYGMQLYATSPAGSPRVLSSQS